MSEWAMTMRERRTLRDFIERLEQEYNATATEVARLKESLDLLKRMDAERNAPPTP